MVDRELSGGIRRAVLRGLLAFVLAIAWVSPAIADPPKPVPRPLRILFVGNSYIYTNDLPRVVEALAASRGQPIVAGEVTRPNYALSDHLDRGEYQQQLTRGWDWVILQQGPSSLPENQIDLRENATLAAAAAFAVGARVALMAAWPAETHLHTQANAEYSYRQAAYAARGCVLPVSTAWRLTRETQPAIRLYQDDQLHPTREGTLLSALVIVRGLLGARAYPPDLALGNDWRQAGARLGVLDAIAAAADMEPVDCVVDKPGRKRGSAASQ